MEALDFQKNALKEIISRANAYYTGTWRDLTIQPRWASLMVAPTGVGKTTIATLAATAVGAKALRLSAPGWMPAGAHQRGTKETISVIAASVAENDRTFLVIDEICKIANTGNAWFDFIRGEILDLTDKRWPTGLVLPQDEDGENPKLSIEELTLKLKETVFVLGIGTFQEFFDSPGTRRTIGFGQNSHNENDEISAEIIARKLPRELSNRFNCNLIRIPELRSDDYYLIARQAEKSLPEAMRELFRKQVNIRITSAIECKKGVRFLEEAVMAVLLELASKTPELNAISDTHNTITDKKLCTL